LKTFKEEDIVAKKTKANPAPAKPLAPALPRLLQEFARQLTSSDASVSVGVADKLRHDAAALRTLTRSLAEQAISESDDDTSVALKALGLLGDRATDVLLETILTGSESEKLACLLTLRRLSPRLNPRSRLLLYHRSCLMSIAFGRKRLGTAARQLGKCLLQQLAHDVNSPEVGLFLSRAWHLLPLLPNDRSVRRVLEGPVPSRTGR
jgi:hypothetical protein